MSYPNDIHFSINNNTSNNSEQKGNFATVANEMLEFFASSDLTAREFKVVMYMLRQLNGWGLKIAPFQINEIAQGTRLDRSHVIKTLKSLIEKGLITKEKIGKSRTFYYGFTDGMFYRALPIETQKECHLKVAKVATSKVADIATFRVAKLATRKTPVPAPVADFAKSKDSLNIYKDSFKGNFNEKKENPEEWLPEEVVKTEMTKIFQVIQKNLRNEQ